MPLSTVRKTPSRPALELRISFRQLTILSKHHQQILIDFPTVKFDGDNLPLILNALETENNGQRLVLEVAVRETPSEITRKT